MLDIDSCAILDFALIKRGMVSGDMEKNGCDVVLSRLVDELRNITLFLSDRHTGIRCLIKNKYPCLTHEFDVWHLCKSFIKKYKHVFRNSSELDEWRTSLRNHLWWACETCSGDSEELVRRFVSLLHHIADEHEWEDGDGEVRRCLHGELDALRHSNTLWIKKDTPGYEKLQRVVEDKLFLRDIRQCKNYCHTSALESFNNVLLTCVPKKIAFHYHGMVLRTILAIIDHNSNLNKKVVSEVQAFSKQATNWIIKKRYAKQSIVWRVDIINQVINYVLDPSVMPPLNPKYEVLFQPYPLPANAAPVQKPSREEAFANRIIRM